MEINQEPFNNKDFSRQIKEQMELNGVSLECLAVACYTSLNYMNALLDGRARYTTHKITQIKRIFNLK